MATAAEIAETLRETIASSPGVSKITVDGIMVERDELLKTIAFWERRAARAAGSLSTASTINLGNG